MIYFPLSIAVKFKLCLMLEQNIIFKYKERGIVSYKKIQYAQIAALSKFLLSTNIELNTKYSLI